MANRKLDLKKYMIGIIIGNNQCKNDFLIRHYLPKNFLLFLVIDIPTLSGHSRPLHNNYPYIPPIHNQLYYLLLFCGRTSDGTENIFDTNTITGASTDDEHLRKSMNEEKEKGMIQ